MPFTSRKLQGIIKPEGRYENIQMMCIATLIGIITGMLSILFNKTLDFFHYQVFATGIKTLGLTIRQSLLFVPLMGGLVVGVINKYFINENDRGFGVSQVINELDDIAHHIMRPKSVLIKTIGTIVTLGTGLSAGRQGPIVHIGGAVGSNIGYRFRLSDNKIKILIGCGVAGSIAGVFNTPIAATIFVLEIMMNKEHLEYFSAIVISSITSVLITRWVIGDTVFLMVKGSFGLVDHKELIFYVFLGIILGLISTIYTRLLRFSKWAFKQFDLSPVVQPVLGAAIVVGIGYYLPLTFDIQYDTISTFMEKNYKLSLLIMLLIGKMIATAATLGSGGIGGVFIPGLYMGAAAGSIYGKSIQFFNVKIFSIDTYIMVGMGAMFAGFSNAPITATLMLLELTHNYTIILPILLSCVVSSATANLICRDSIYREEKVVKEEKITAYS